MPEESQNKRARKPLKRPHRLAAPKFTSAGCLGPHYRPWYLVLIEKSYRLCTGLPEKVRVRGDRPDSPLSFLKPYLDEWEAELVTWLEEPWLTGLDTTQLEAIYSVLYNLAEAVFELNACPDGKRTCEAAVRKIVRFMNQTRYKHMCL